MVSDVVTATSEVIERARRGDSRALGELWRIYQPQVLRFLEIRSCSEPDDVASKVWIEVGRTIADFDGEATSLRAWLLTLARDAHLDQIRRVDVTRVAVDANAESIADWRSARDVDVDAERFALERATAMLAPLPPAQAEAVLLRVVYDLSIDDVAMILQSTPSNVRVMVHRGLARLRRRLGGIEVGGERPFDLEPRRRPLGAADDHSDTEDTAPLPTSAPATTV